MNLKQLLHHFTEELIEIYEEQEIISIFNIAAQHISGLNRSQLMLKWAVEVEADKEQDYLFTLNELSAGKPIQYVIGETVFYGLPFKVNPSVLIPRPETEELVEWVIENSDFTGNSNSGLKIMDIGTGSGCIAVSLKKNLVSSVVFALDISKLAIETASANATLNQVDIAFIKADICSFSTTQKFDVIISNPPYITVKEMEQMHENVLVHEPHLALFVPNEKPLLFYEVIADFAKGSLNHMGFLFFEINENFGKEIVQMLKHKSFINIELKKDMQGKDRMVRCSLH